MKIQLRYFMTLLLMMVVSVGWCETKTEGFEKKARVQIFKVPLKSPQPVVIVESDGRFTMERLAPKIAFQAIILQPCAFTTKKLSMAI